MEYGCSGECSPEIGLLLSLTDSLTTCVIVIFRVKVSCITSVDGALLVVCHLSSDVVGCKD